MIKPDFLSNSDRLILTCLKKDDTVSVTGRKESRQAPNSSGDQLRLFSVKLRLSREPRRVSEPPLVPLFRFTSSKLDELCLRSGQVYVWAQMNNIDPLMIRTWKSEHGLTDSQVQKL